MRPLLFRLPIQIGESWLSLLDRVEAANFYTRAILSALVLQGDWEEKQPNRRLRDSIEWPELTATYRRLSYLTGVAPRRLYAATAHRFAAALTPPGRDITRVAVPYAQGEAVEMMPGLT